jgi:transposase
MAAPRLIRLVAQSRVKLRRPWLMDGCQNHWRITQSIFHALWLLSLGYEVEEIAELLSFSPRWVRALIKRYNEGGAEALGDQRVHNGTKPMILTPEALTALKERIKTPPDDGGHWTGPKIARWLAKFHGVQAAHDQRGWDALIAIEARMSLRRFHARGPGGREAGSFFALRHASDTSQALASSVIVGSLAGRGRSSSAASGPSTTARVTQRWTV